MYEERRDSFSLRDIIIQVLFVALFIFILMWLFPTKNFVTNYVDGAIEDAVNESLENYEFGGGINSEAFANQLFNQNVLMMKDAAKDYFTISRLPENNGDKVKITLVKMLDEKIILPFVDSKGNTCDLEESYVLVTKNAEEYIMKVNLKCSDYEDYLIVHMGCYDYCSTTICETKKPVTTPTKDPVVIPEPTPTPNPEPTPEPTPVVYEYEYKLVVDGKWGEWGNWSDWSENLVSKTDYREVETKIEQVQTGTKTEKVKIGEKTEHVAVGTKTEKVQIGTKTEKVQVGTKTEKVQVGTKTIKVQTGTKTEKVQVGTKTEKYVSGTKPKYGTKEVPVCVTVTVPLYENVVTYYYDCTNGCRKLTKTTPVKVGETTKEDCSGTKTIEVQVGVELIYSTRQVPVYEDREVPVYEDREVPVYEEKEVPVYEDREVPVYEEKEVTIYEDKVVDIYEEKEVPVYSNVTYYRSRTREYIDGTTDIKWSRSQNDLTLIKQGYTLTGGTRVA